MKANVETALEFVGSAPANGRDSDEMRRLAILHVVQVVGEAARRVPTPARELAPAIPWARIVGIRSFIVHEYDHLDPRILMDVLHSKFPTLLPQLVELLRTVKERGDAPLP